MKLTSTTRKPWAFACSALAIALVAGCNAQGGGIASASSAGTVRVKLDGNVEKSVAIAERAVAKAPADAAARVALAKAYLGVGRFQSAATTFEDAVSLGEDTPAVALGRSLAYIGLGRNAEALALLDSRRAEIASADYGLAIALAGQPSQGVDLLSNALRGGENTPQIRQNLAYAYALDGRWREARIMAAQDVPADQLDARIRDWAVRGRPEDYKARVAGLLGAPLRADQGQPAMLALGGVERPAMAVEAPQPAAGELAALDGTAAAPAAAMAPVFAPVPAQAPAQAAPQAATTLEAPVMAAASAPAPGIAPDAAAKLTFVANPVVQPLPSPVQRAARQASTRDEAPAARPVQPVAARQPARLAPRVAALTEGTHLVQLGSFATRAGAERAWGIYVARNPSLAGHAMRISEATVNGRRYFRVAAEGFDDGGARAMCSKVTQSGGGCLAYADGALTSA